MFRKLLDRRARGASGRPRDSRKRGVVLLWATLTIMFIAGVVMARTDDLKAVDDLTLEALDKLERAKVRVAQSPPDAKAAVGAVTQAIIRMTDALETGLDPNAFSNELHNGPNTLYPQIRDMVNTMITDSTAPAPELATATDSYAIAVAKMDRARDRMTAGNVSGAMTDYKNAASKFRAAIDAIDDFQ